MIFVPGGGCANRVDSLRLMLQDCWQPDSRSSFIAREAPRPCTNWWWRREPQLPTDKRFTPPSYCPKETFHEWWTEILFSQCVDD